MLIVILLFAIFLQVHGQHPCFPSCMCDVECNGGSGVLVTRSWGDGNAETYDMNVTRLLSIPGTFLRATIHPTSGEFLFSDGGYQRSVKVFNRGVYQRTIGEGILQNPTGLTMVSNDVLAVGDGARRAVIYINYTTGEEIRMGPAVQGPWFMTINSQGVMIISDGGMKTVRGYDPNNDDLLFEYTGANQGNAFSPNDVGVDANDFIVVADYTNNVIHRTSANGIFQGYLATADDGLASPMGVSVCNNNLFIGTGNGELHMLPYSTI